MGVKVRERPKGSDVWWIFVDFQGKRKAKKVGSKAAAEEAARKIEAKLTLGQRAFPKKKLKAPMLKDYFQGFKETYLSTAVRHSTRQSYKENFKNHIIPELGQLRVDELTRKHSREFVSTLVGKGLARATIRIITAQLCAMLSEAREDGVIRDNPATKLSRFYRNASVKHEHIQPLNADEVRVFLKATLKYAPEQYTVFLCGIHTGMRTGELVGLQWGDVDFFGKFLTVRRNIVRRRINPTKNSKIRRIDMSDALLDMLKALKQKRREQWLAKGENSIPKWVFCATNGNFMDPYNLKDRHFYRCLEKAGLRRIRFHDLRHTYASLLIQAGTPLAYVRDQLGHSSIKMTVDVYGHLEPGRNRQVLNGLPTEKDVSAEALEKTVSE